MKADDAERLQEFEKDNAQLQGLVADQALDIDVPKWNAVDRGEIAEFSLPGSQR